MLVECKGKPVMIHLRGRARDLQATILQKMIQGSKGAPAPPLWIRNALIKYHAMCWNNTCAHTERLWIGTWNDDTVRLITGQVDLDRMVDYDERQLFHKCIRDLMAPLRDLSPLLLQSRMEHIAAGRTVSGAARQRCPAFKRNAQPLARAGFTIPSRRSTKKTEFAKPLVGGRIDTSIQMTMRQMFQMRIPNTISEDAEDGDEDEDAMEGMPRGEKDRT